MMSSAATAIVLIILAGLMVSTRARAALRQLLSLHPMGHYRFEIIVATDLGRSCSNKDFNTGCVESR